MTGPTHGDSLSSDAGEVLRRVNLSFRERGWPEEVHRHLIQGGMVAELGRAPRSPGEADERVETVPMDVAVAAVAGVVGGMMRLEEKDERRHQERMATARRSARQRGSVRRLPTRTLLAQVVRRGAARLRRPGSGVTP
jgi:hypothetical protein